MSRSTYVYVVQRLVGMPVLAAFTVKHELVSWLRKRPGQVGAVQILRFYDGDGPKYNDGVVVTHHIVQEVFK